MDRHCRRPSYTPRCRLRHTALVLVSIAGFALLLSACMTTSREFAHPAPTVVSTETPPVLERRPAGPSTTHEQEADEVPDVSLPAPVVSDTDEPAGLSALANEFHLSGSTGWLILPEPRITDDLAPPSLVEWTDDLALPVPRIISADRPKEHCKGDFAGKTDLVTRLGGESSGSDMQSSSASERRSEPAPAAGWRSALGTATSPVTAAPPVTATPPVSGDTLDTGATPATRSLPDLPSASGSTPEMAPNPGVRIEPTQEATEDLGPASRETWVRRRAVVDPGSSVRLTLPGSGWIYVGREYGPGTVDLVEKISVAGDDEFVFDLLGDGEYGLWFQREDPVSGVIENERMELTARGDGSQLVAVVEGTERPRSSTGGDSGPVQDADTRADRDPEVPSHDEERSSALEIAEAALEAGDPVLAAENYALVFAQGNETTPDLRLRFFEAAMASETPDHVNQAVQLLVESGEMTPDLNDRVLRLASAATDADSVMLLESLIGAAPVGAKDDEILFELAERLQAPGQARDLERALELYERIVADFPLSRFWDQSRAGIEYLNRHFFDVR